MLVIVLGRKTVTQENDRKSNSPIVEKPKICCDTLDVRPVSISWRCRNTLERAEPLPLSNEPLVKTPINVLLPLSTLPITATLTSFFSSFCCESCLTKTSAHWLPFSWPSRILNTLYLVPVRLAHIWARVCNVSSISVGEMPVGVPLSATPNMYVASFPPSARRKFSWVVKCCRRSGSTEINFNLYSTLPSSFSCPKCGHLIVGIGAVVVVVVLVVVESLVSGSLDSCAERDAMYFVCHQAGAGVGCQGRKPRSLKDNLDRLMWLDRKLTSSQIFFLRNCHDTHL